MEELLLGAFGGAMAGSLVCGLVWLFGLRRPRVRRPNPETRVDLNGEDALARYQRMKDGG